LVPASWLSFDLSLASNLFVSPVMVPAIDLLFNCLFPQFEVPDINKPIEMATQGRFWFPVHQQPCPGACWEQESALGRPLSST
jgi:hypothetical protein